MEINERVKMIRKSLGLTQSEFGEKIDVAQGYLTNIENGKRDVTEKILKLICSIYNVSEDWFRNGTGSMFIQNEWDVFAQSKGLDKDETLFLKAYMSIDKNIRQAAIKQFVQFYNEQAVSFEEEKSRKLEQYGQELDSEKNSETSSASRTEKDKGSA